MMLLGLFVQRMELFGTEGELVLGGQCWLNPFVKINNKEYQFYSLKMSYIKDLKHKHPHFMSVSCGGLGCIV